MVRDDYIKSLIYGYDRYFTVENLQTKRAYVVLGGRSNTIDDVWNNQKGFFLRGTKVKISDDKGNSKIFMKK